MKIKDNVLDTILLLALPASGKSEVRKYLKHLSADACAKDFHMGPTLQLDDFPYVHIMRRFDEELKKLGKPYIFYLSPDRPFQNSKEWGTLTMLMNQDYDDLIQKRPITFTSASEYIFNKVFKARKDVGIPEANIDPETKTKILAILEKECAELLVEKQALQKESLEGRSIVIEFARGGPDGSTMPLKDSYGYQYSLSCLSPTILERAVILYVWVTPEESRRKNEARTNPNDPGSILHHGVPLEVMLNDYGCDDIEWLIKNSEKKGTVTINAHGRKFYLPIGRFDNRVDKTSFLRDDANSWKPEQVKAVHDGLKQACDEMWEHAKE